MFITRPGCGRPGECFYKLGATAGGDMWQVIMFARMLRIYQAVFGRDHTRCGAAWISEELPLRMRR